MVDPIERAERLEWLRKLVIVGAAEKNMICPKIHALCMIGLISLTGLVALPSFAGTCSDITVRIRDAKVLPPGGQCEVIDLPDQLLVLIRTDANFSADALKTLALKLAQVMAPVVTGKRTVITFADGSAAGHLTAVTVSADQIRGLHEKTSNVEASALDAVLADSAIIRGAATAPSTNAEMSNLQMERNKLTTHIEQLRAKRVGVKPFVDEIARADEQLKEGNVTQAKAILDHLNGAIEDYEQQAKEARISGHAATYVSQQPPSRPRPNLPAMTARGGGALFGTAADRASAASLPAGSDGYYDEIANQILKRQVGDLAPIDGPMRLERYTIAKRITTLRQSGADVNNYITAFRKIEEIAGSKDPQKVLLLRDEIQYLNKQLGIQ